MPTQPSRTLETVPAPDVRQPYRVECVCPEFTCLCPVTGQPDFATITLTYTPAARLIELKSLKLYLWSFREEGLYHEAVTNQIADDVVAAAAPRALRVVARFNVRGGITTTVAVDRP